MKWAAGTDHCILGLFGGLEIKLVQHLEESLHALATWKTGLLFLISRERSLKAQVASQAEMGMVETIFSLVSLTVFLANTLRRAFCLVPEIRNSRCLLNFT